MSKEQKVFKSDFIIEIDSQVVIIKTETEARKKFRSSISKESNNICYLYRRDYTEKGKLIETYMLA